MTHTRISAIRLSAASIIRSFQNSNKKHLILTGSRGSGKTTLLKQLCSLLPYPPPAIQSPAVLPPGITTRAVPGKYVLLTENSTGRSAIIGSYPPQETGEIMTPNRMQPVAEGFLSLGIPALERLMWDSVSPWGGTAQGQPAAPGWAALDELGYLEDSCPAFQEAVRRLLDRKRVIAVLRSQDTPFLSGIRSREDVFVYDLDRPVLPVGCILMASGMGRRFGGNKLLAPFHGEPLFLSCLRTTKQPVFSAHLTVTRHPSVAALCRVEDAPYLLHELPNRSDTIRLGLEQLSSLDIQGCLFCQADQPLLTAESLETMLLSFSREPDFIYRLCDQGQSGSPVLFPRRLFQELRQLPSGKGGSFLIQKYPGQVRCIPAWDACELFDADTPEALEVLRSL